MSLRPARAAAVPQLREELNARTALSGSLTILPEPSKCTDHRALTPQRTFAISAWNEGSVARQPGKQRPRHGATVPGPKRYCPDYRNLHRPIADEEERQCCGRDRLRRFRL